MSNPTELPDLDALLAEHSSAVINYAEHGDIGSYYNDLVSAENAIRELVARRAKPEGEAPQAEAMAAFKKWHQEVGDQDCEYTWLQAWTAAQLSKSTSAPGTPEAPQTAAARDVLVERLRQVTAEGWTPDHDDHHDNGQMAVAAGYYALACGWPKERDIGLGRTPVYWPWAPEWWKPRTKRENLVRAGALVLAEIERLDRAARLDGGQEGSAT